MSFFRGSLAVLALVLCSLTVAAQESDLSVSKSGPESAAADTNVTFTIQVVNGGPDDASSATLTDVIPAGLTFVSIDETNNPDLFTCTSPAVGSGGTITCNAATFTAGSSSDFTIVLHVDSETPPGTTFTNIATVTSPSDPNDENNSSAASFTTPGGTSADVSATKSGPSNALPNSDVPFVIVISNAGPTEAQNVNFTDTLPGDMTFVSLSSPGGWSCTTPAVGAGGTVSCANASLGAGASASFTLIGHIPSGPSGTQYQNEVTVNSTSPDPNSENNTAIATVTTSSADVSITKAGPATATAGGTISWTLTAANAGPDTAVSVFFSDQLPIGTAFVSLTQDNGPATSNCSTPAPGQNGEVNCSFDSLDSGNSAQFTLTANIASNVPNDSTINNTATIVSDNGDPNTTNNSQTATTTINTSADVGVAKVGSPDPVTAGANLAYTITVNNAGPSNAASVSLTDTLPAGTTFVSLSSPGGWSCNTPAVGAGGTVSCENASLGVGTAVFTLTVAVNSNVSTETVLSNTASASSATADPNPGNESGTATTTVISPANVFGAKTASGTFTAGSTATYTIVLTNNGGTAQGDNPGNEFTDILPASLTLVSASASAGTAVATVGSNTVTWNGSLAGNGGTVTITITATIKETNPFGATISNQGTISYDADNNGTNEASRLTDDPSVEGAADPTSFTVAGQPTISIDDVSKAEGSSGTTNYTFNVTLNGASSLTVKVDYATADGTATAPSDYTALTTSTLTFNPGDLTKPVTVVVNGDTSNELDETFFVNLTTPVNATIADNQGLGTILNDDSTSIQFNAATYTINEGAVNTPEGFASLTVQVDRSGDLSGAATVRYATADLSGNNECTVTNGNASQRCDYLMLSGTLRFAAGDASKTFQIPIVNDGYVEGPELFTIELSNVTGGTLGAASLTTVTITDDDSVATDAAHNPYLSNPFFVRMHYVDFLEREPDTAGFNDWVGVLDGCGPQHGFLGAPASCDRAHVSEGFFGATEFIDRGFLVYRLYDLGLNRLPLYAEFNADSAQLRGFGLTSAEQQQNLDNYLLELGARTEFVNRYAAVAATSQASQLIDLLEMTAGVTLPATATTLPGQPSQYGRADLIDKRATGQFSVVETVKAFAEQKVVYDKYFPRGFVTMQYFAYLHRDPDTAGWNDWVDVVVNGRPSEGIAPGDYRHLIFGFIYSSEYRKRFGQP